jgi:CyaY protein
MMTTALSESDYDSVAQPELQALITSLDAIASDEIEAELASDILTIEFTDGTRYVINSHRAARQIWLAAERSAWHFDFRPAQKDWVAGKTGDELWSTLTRLISEKLGEPLTLRRG